MVSSNPRAPAGQSSWRISALAAYKAHGFSPKLIFYSFSLRHTLCQFPSCLFYTFSTQSFTQTQLSSVHASLPTTSVRLSSPVPFFCLSLVAIHLLLQILTLVPPLSLFMSRLFFSPHPVWSGSQRSVWSAEHSCLTPAGQRCQPPLPEQLVRGIPPSWRADSVYWDRMHK